MSEVSDYWKPELEKAWEENRRLGLRVAEFEAAKEHPTEQPDEFMPAIDTKLVAVLEKLSSLANAGLLGDGVSSAIAKVMIYEALGMAKNPPYAAHSEHETPQPVALPPCPFEVWECKRCGGIYRPPGVTECDCSVGERPEFNKYLLASPERELRALQIATTALNNIAANTSDSGKSRGKGGTDWVAARCGELACQALVEIEEQSRRG